MISKRSAGISSHELKAAISCALNCLPPVEVMYVSGSRRVCIPTCYLWAACTTKNTKRYIGDWRLHLSWTIDVGQRVSAPYCHILGALAPWWSKVGENKFTLYIVSGWFPKKGVRIDPEAVNTSRQLSFVRVFGYTCQEVLSVSRHWLPCLTSMWLRYISTDVLLHLKETSEFRDVGDASASSCSLLSHTDSFATMSPPCIWKDSSCLQCIGGIAR